MEEVLFDGFDYKLTPGMDAKLVVDVFRVI
jgi:hypothetical protein